MSEQLSNRVLATPSGELIESEQMQEARLQNIGKNEIETGWLYEKDYVNEQERAEMAVAQIDEKMLGLEMSDMNNPNNTKDHNHLRDMRDFLIHMGTPEKGYAKVQELEQAGKKDEAEIARAGLELTSVIASEADGLGNTKPAIEEHNQRVQNNAKQRALIEQREPLSEQWKPLSDEEIAAAKSQIDRLMDNTTPEREKNKRNPHMNEAESRVEATQRIYGSPELVAELFDESVAFADFVEKTAELDRLALDLNRFRRDLPEIRQAIDNWTESGLSVDFKSYLEETEEADVRDQIWEAAVSAKAALRNQMWRESAMARRMNSKIEDKTEVGAGEKFRLTYFA